MKFIKQLSIILGVTCVGEMMKYFLPLPIPASIYGLLLMMGLLVTGIVKLESVRETGEFLIEIMPLMFIPAGVGLIESWEQLSGMLIPVLVITVISTFAVMIVTGKVSDLLIGRKSESGRNSSSKEEL